jgi:hypothetical protein
MAASFSAGLTVSIGGRLQTVDDFWQSQWSVAVHVLAGPGQLEEVGIYAGYYMGPLIDQTILIITFTIGKV